MSRADDVVERYAPENGWELSAEEFLPKADWHFGGALPTWRMSAHKPSIQMIVVERSGLSSRSKMLIRLYGAMNAVDGGLLRSPSAARRGTGRRTWHMVRRPMAGGIWCWCGQDLRDAEEGEWAEVKGRKCRRCPKRWDKEYAALLRPILEALEADQAEADRDARLCSRPTTDATSDSDGEKPATDSGTGDEV